MSDMADGPGLVERAAMRLRREQAGGGSRTALPLPEAEPERQARGSDATPRAGATADLARSWSGRSRQEEIDFARLRDAGMVTPDAEWSEVAEQFRIVKRPLLLRAFDAAATRHPNANVVMVTSARPGEGKTFTACNLALSIAREQDYSVLLVDADIRRPSVARVLGLGSEGIGLTDLLDDPAIDPGDAMIRASNLRNLAVIPSGRPDHRAPELFASHRMSRLVQSFAARYRDRIVVIDTPPALATSEPSVISLCAGQALLVVEADRTRASAIRAALALIGRCPSISLLLNKTRPSLARDEFGPGGYGYGYGYGYGEARGRGARSRGKDAGVQ